MGFLNRWAVRRIERQYRPRGAFVVSDGQRLHYAEAGEGLPVIFLHGASGTLGDFTLGLLTETAAAGYRAIAFDRPGHGYSDRLPGPMSPADQAAAIRKALATLAIERPILVGHSWSGSLILAYALTWPDEVRGIVSIGGVSHSWPGNGISWHQRLAAKPVIGPLFVYTALAPVGRLLIPGGVKRVFAPDQPAPGYADQAGVPLILRPRHYQTNALDLSGLKAFLAELSRRYGELVVPLAIVHGTQDRTVPAEVHALPLHDKVPDSKLILLEGVGHMPHHVRSDAVLDAIRWIEERSSGHRHSG